MVRCRYQSFSVEGGVSSGMVLGVVVLSFGIRRCRRRGVVGGVGLCAKQSIFRCPRPFAFFSLLQHA